MTDETITPTPARRKPALGRGLQALMGDSRREEPVVATAPSTGEGGTLRNVESGLAQLAIASIEPDPTQPRRHFDDAALDELAASIAARGVISRSSCARWAMGAIAWWRANAAGAPPNARACTKSPLWSAS